MRGLDQNMSDSLVKYFNDELDGNCECCLAVFCCSSR
uniref:Uncharacterized protein n=1 Tax=Meloidogyne hapla TaxID=6305 RepID=A0A1I8C1K7_MELHA